MIEVKKMEDIFKRFEKKEKLHIGEFSEIYRALEINTKKEYALKIISKIEIENKGNKDYMNYCIKREIEITNNCKCENIVEVYEVIETKDSFIFVLELCDIDFEKYLQENCEQRNIYFIRNQIIGLNKALKILYEKNVMHRDIKPSNIFLKFKNDECIPKLGDFGISTYYNDKNLSSSVGTPLFMAPEIIKDEKYNCKIDLYSLGVTLYYLIFNEYPYYGNNEFQLIKDIESNKPLKKTGLESLDDLIVKLLKVSPNERISFEDYFNHQFFKETDNLLKNFKIKNEDVQNNKNIKIEDDINKICNIAESFVDIMNIPNGKINQTNIKVKMANIIYYDENINKHIKSIHTDSDLFERKTPGTFILSTNLLSLNIVMEEIKKKNTKYDRRYVFNLIVTGSQCEKVMEFLIKNKYEQFFQNICIYCMKIEKYIHLSKKYNKIKGVFNKPNNIIKFIEDVSSYDTKEFPFTKIVTYNDYKDKYYERHEKISEFYGNLTVESYIKASKELNNFINNKEENDLKIKKDVLIESFKTFDLSKDLETLDKLIINEYTKNTFYGDMNQWLRSLNTNVYEKIAYYTARLMYSLNNYGLKSNNFFKEQKILYRGAKTSYINILSFERLKGKIIILSAFTSSSENEDIAINWSGRKNSREVFKNSNKFSVIYKIINHVIPDSISCGINIQNESKYKKEKEILFQPFSFYYVKNVFFDYKNYLADIELETIVKKEILEEKIRIGKKVIYDKNANLVRIDE